MDNIYARTWNARKACDLLDSIYYNYPSGRFSFGRLTAATKTNSGSTTTSFPTSIQRIGTSIS